MAAVLSTCTVEEQRSVICFLWSESVKPSEIYRRWRFNMEKVVWVRGECMNVWKDFKTEDKTSVMNTGVGDQLAWQLRQWNSKSSSESFTIGESLLMKLPYNSTWIKDLRTILFIMTSGIGKYVADGSQSSCPMITTVHGRRFVRSIWTVMLVKEMFFSIDLWQETSPGCTIMNQRVRDNQCSGSTRLLRPAKNSRHRLPLGKSCWPSFGFVNESILVHFQEKCQTLTSAQYSDMLANELKPAIRSKRREILSQKKYCCFTKTPATVRLRIQWIHYVLWNLGCWNIHHTVRTWRHRTFTCLDLWKNICAAGSLQLATR
jgi:hypothetical protein